MFLFCLKNWANVGRRVIIIYSGDRCTVILMWNAIYADSLSFTTLIHTRRIGSAQCFTVHSRHTVINNLFFLETDSIAISFPLSSIDIRKPTFWHVFNDHEL